MALSLLLGLIQIQLSRALRLPFSRMLVTLEIGTWRRVHGHLIFRCCRRPLAKGMSSLRLELFRNVLFSPTAVPAVWVAALINWLLELFAPILPDVAHLRLLACVYNNGAGVVP